MIVKKALSKGTHPQVTISVAFQVIHSLINLFYLVKVFSEATETELKKKKKTQNVPSLWGCV